MTKTVEELISAAHRLVGDLLPTEVTAFDVEKTTAKRCPDWSVEDADAALRLAVEFADIEGNALLSAEHSSHADNMAEMEHHLFVAYELGDRLDLPVVFEWDDAVREQSILSRHVLYPLRRK